MKINGIPESGNLTNQPPDVISNRLSSSERTKCAIPGLRCGKWLLTYLLPHGIILANFHGFLAVPL